MHAVDGGINLVGNINNPVTLYSKGPEDVRAEVFRNLDAGVQLIAPECAIPPKNQTRKPPRNPKSRRRLGSRTLGLLRELSTNPLSLDGLHSRHSGGSRNPEVDGRGAKFPIPHVRQVRNFRHPREGGRFSGRNVHPERRWCGAS